MRSTARPLSLLLLVLATACSGATAKVAAISTPTPTPTPSATASPTPSPTPAPSGNPLTGLGLVSGPVVALKVDNGILARPYQRGMTQAAVVYQELVEGGATRFIAVFQSATARKEVGPVRSARESDIDILRAYGKASLGFSGAQPGVIALIRSAARKGHLIDASYDANPSLYRLGERRRDARNFFAVPSRLGQRRGGSEARDIGFRFGTLGAGLATASARAPFSPQSTVGLRYNASTGTWVVSQGSRAVPIAPANVVIQYVATQRSRFHDKNGMNTPLTITTGSGNVVVLRDGMRFVGTWKRTGYGATRLLDATGRDILLKPGQTFVMLVPRGRSASFGA